MRIEDLKITEASASGDLLGIRLEMKLAADSYYPERDPDGAHRQEAERSAIRAIWSKAYMPLREPLQELLKELEQAPESKRRNRCLALARRTLQMTFPKFEEEPLQNP